MLAVLGNAGDSGFAAIEAAAHAAAVNLSPGPRSRAWDYWTARAEQAGAAPGR